MVCGSDEGRALLMARRYGRFRMTPEFLRAILLLPGDVSVMSVHGPPDSVSSDLVVEVSGESIDCPDDGTMHDVRPMYEKDAEGKARFAGWEPVRKAI